MVKSGKGDPDGPLKEVKFKRYEFNEITEIGRLIWLEGDLNTGHTMSKTKVADFRKQVGEVQNLGIMAKQQVGSRHQ